MSARHTTKFDRGWSETNHPSAQCGGTGLISSILLVLLLILVLGAVDRITAMGDAAAQRVEYGSD